MTNILTKVDDHTKKLLHKVHQVEYHSFGFNAEATGSYTYCFSNAMSHDVVDVTFTVHGPDEQSKFRIKVEKTDETALENEVETELNFLADEINNYRDEASYIIERDRRHRQTAESTKSRVLWWSLTQTAI
ncbi:p24 complex component, partial [Nowakowskiella sp. JEL0078]